MAGNGFHCGIFKERDIIQGDDTSGHCPPSTNVLPTPALQVLLILNNT